VPDGSTNGEEINAMLCRWVPPHQYACFNETIGGICQIIGSGGTKTVLQVERELGYESIFNKLINK
jgi:hypothetical protein